MLQAFGLARLGRDAETRFTPGGDAVCNLSLAFDIRNKNEKLTQWVDAALWGKQAEALAEYLVKGKQIAVQLEDLRIEEFTDRDGNKRSKLAARVAKIDLAGGGRDEGAAPAPASRQAPAPAPRPAAKTAGGSGFDDMDDDIPF